MFISFHKFIKWILLSVIFYIYNFFKLRDATQNQVKIQTPDLNESFKNYNYLDENSDVEDVSFKASTANNSRISKLSSNSDDDNNNDSSITPTLNKSIPRITPIHNFTNSTPLNHYNSQENNSNRKYRRDPTRAWYENF